MGADGTSGIRTIFTYGFETLTDNKQGDLVQVTYENDPTSTPNVTYSYDRLGRRTGASSSVDAITLAYNGTGQLLSEASRGARKK